MSDTFGTSPSAFAGIAASFNSAVFTDDFSGEATEFHIGAASELAGSFQEPNRAKVVASIQGLREMANTVKASIDTAYHVGTNPAKTEEEIQVLKMTLEQVSHVLRETGLGALPMIVLGEPIPSDSQLLTDANRCIDILHQQLMKRQEGAANIANLLHAQVQSVPIRR
ncbi:hypothetical protein CYLTODRAFT_450738 [Cylindrobasidium torrendii FP15055 ss-10]|uniref:Uncharacterized protein n=1 Tax=Cylindrobasidium torrendii FP15055 ss-10 TaxID=1314674 RepID=A0A0D7BPP5_9AGAR|nr:hypothetical protein CYLTODRAFT_450738 [Cylindrobasidium torrendii FP15055 ss-10]